MSLRSMLASLATSIAALAIGAAIALTLGIGALVKDTERVSRSFASVRLLEEAQLELLRHSRASQLVAVGASTAAVDPNAGADAVRDLLSREFSVTRPEQRPLLAKLRSEIDDYFRHRPSKRLQSDIAVSVREAKPFLDRALSSIDELVGAANRDAKSTREAAEMTAHRARLAMLPLFFAMLLCVAWAVWILERRVRAPLESVRDAMHEFSTGKRGRRAPEIGPLELKETARSFNRMADTLDRKHEQLLAFVAGVAHDLRTPVAALKLAAFRLPSHEDRPAPAIMQRQIQSLERMLDDLVDSARIEAGQLDLLLENRDLREVVRSTLELLESALSQHEVEIDLPALPVGASIDAGRIEQVLANLLSNAIKYSPNGDRIRIRLEANEVEACISISDQGIGIAEGDLPHIFDPFRRAPIARRTSKGAGLGLSVARRIVEAHGGGLSCESTPGQGSTFFVRLPRPSSETRETSDARPGMAREGHVHDDKMS